MLVWKLLLTLCLLSVATHAHEKGPRIQRDLDSAAQPAMTGKTKLPEPLRRDVYETEVVHLLCRWSGNPKSYVVWYKDGAPLIISEEDDRRQITKTKLKLDPVTRDDSGNYSCQVKNEHGEDWRNFTLTVRSMRRAEGSGCGNGDDRADGLSRESALPDGHPRWTRRKIDMLPIKVEVQGAHVKMACPAEGCPQPSITWLLNGQALKPRNYAGIKINKKGTLKIERVSPDHSGTYTCIATNGHGSINFTHDLDLVPRVPQKPIFREPPQNLTVTVGSSATMRCKVISNSHPHLQWLKHYEVNGSYVSDDDVPYINVLSRTSDPETLVIENVTWEDAGWYTCLAGNALGIVHRSAWLKVVEVVNDTQSLGPVLVESVDEPGFDDDNNNPPIVVFVGVGSACFITAGALVFLIVSHFRPRKKSYTKLDRIRNSELSYDKTKQKKNCSSSCESFLLREGLRV